MNVEERRVIVDERHVCTCPREYLTEPWDSLPEDVKDYISGLRGLPCDGGGTPGWWCNSNVMRLCKWYENEEMF